MRSAVLIVLAASLAAAIACGGSSLSDAETAVGGEAFRVSAAAEPVSAFESQFYCRDSEGPVLLERYLIGAHREDGIPRPTSADYREALPPVCVISPMGGVPPYEATASVGDRPLPPVVAGTTELLFRLPPLPPGEHTVEFAVTDSKGQTGYGRATVVSKWDNPDRVAATFLNPPSQLAEFPPGEVVEFQVEYEAHEPSEQPQLGMEYFAPQTYTVTWEFGDGVVETHEVSERKGLLTASHVYAEEGLYEATVAITGQTFAQTGAVTLNVDIRPTGSTRSATGEVVLPWNLIETRVNPANEPLRSYDIDRVFADDSLNKYVSRTVSMDTGKITVGKVTGKGSSETFVGSYEFDVTSLPAFLPGGESASIVIDGTAIPAFGLDAAGEALRVSGLPGGQPDAVLPMTGDAETSTLEAVFDVPIPGKVGDTIVITASVDGCAACVIQWVYRYG